MSDLIIAALIIGGSIMCAAWPISKAIATARREGTERHLALLANMEKQLRRIASEL